MHFKSVYPNGVTRLERIHPLIVPKKSQNPQIMMRKNARLRIKYTSESDAKIIKELYTKASVCPPKKLSAFNTECLEIASIVKQSTIESSTWIKRE